MKKLLLLAGLLAPLLSRGVTVTNYITDVLGNPLYTRVVFTPFTPSTVFGGTNVVGISVGLFCTNGVWYTDVLPGWYLVDQGDGAPTIPIFCAYGETTNNLAYFATAATNPIPTFAYDVDSIGTVLWESSGGYVQTVETNEPVKVWGLADMTLTPGMLVEVDGSNRLVSTDDISVTNINTTNINTVTLNVTSNVTANTIVVLSGLYPTTNAWSGPTNPIQMHLTRQRYVTWTPIHVTGFSDLSNSVTEPVLLSVSNAASTNVLALFSGVTSVAYTNQYTISNTSTAKIWLEYDPSGPDTNVVFRQTR